MMFYCCDRCRACLFYLIAYNPSQWEVREGTQGSDWNRGHGGGAYWISLHGLLVAFLYTQNHLLTDGTTRSGLDPHTSAINQENVLYTFVQARLMEAFS